MKNRYLIILGLLIAFFVISPILSNAQTASTAAEKTKSVAPIKYTPNVPIPINIGKYNFADEEVTIKGGDFLASYIVALYSYGAGFAGIVAMFMLVIAGWRWLMAGGNAQKINESKDMVTSVLIGLAILFGGQLLLRQISSNFDSIQSLSIELPTKVLNSITTQQKGIEDQATNKFCKGLDENGLVIEDKAIKACGDYKDLNNCVADTCNLAAPSSYSKKCLPIFKGNSLNIISNCVQCNSGRKCSAYKSAYLKKLDPCDYDKDGKGGSITDPDGCVDNP